MPSKLGSLCDDVIPSPLPNRSCVDASQHLKPQHTISRVASDTKTTLGKSWNIQKDRWKSRCYHHTTTGLERDLVNSIHSTQASIPHKERQRKCCSREFPSAKQITSILATLHAPPPFDYLHLPRIDHFNFRATDSSAPVKPPPASSARLPRLDPYQQQASAQYWPGATSSTEPGHTSTAQALNTLPTPPTDGPDCFKAPGLGLRTEFPNLATATLQQPGMPSSLEHTGASTSLTQRRPAANNLPNFELPAPFNQQFQQKFALPHLNATQQSTNVGGGNLLTPPSTVPPGDSLSPLSSIITSANATQGMSSNYNYGWPPLNTGLTPLMGTASGNTPQPWPGALNPVRGLFSPSLAGSLPRADSNSPTAGEALPPQTYDLNSLPPLPTSLSMAAPSNLPATAAQQQATLQAFMNQSQNQQIQTPVSATATQPSPLHGTDPYAQRPQSTPGTFYSNSQPSSAQQSSFPPFHTQSSPIEQSPMSAPPQGSRLSPMSAQSSTFAPSISQGNYFGRSSYGPYLPALSAPGQLQGPMMSNLHNPANSMGMMGIQGHGLPGGVMPSYNSGHAAQLQQQMYGTQQQTPHNERPFKCDQCPQSFNRNHDLKRHKRIHLAVKPFPCGYCDKSFSRKDALKVWIFNHIVQTWPLTGF